MIRCCLCGSSDSIPSPGTFMGRGCGQERKKEKVQLLCILGFVLSVESIFILLSTVFAVLLRGLEIITEVLASDAKLTILKQAKHTGLVPTSLPRSEAPPSGQFPHRGPPGGGLQSLLGNQTGLLPSDASAPACLQVGSVVTVFWPEWGGGHTACTCGRPPRPPSSPIQRATARDTVGGTL